MLRRRMIRTKTTPAAGRCGEAMTWRRRSAAARLRPGTPSLKTIRKPGPGKDGEIFSLFGGGGGPAANFGPRGGGQGIGPKSKIFGHGSNVRSIVYVCDASGSMVGQGDDALKTELKRDIANLSPIQQFNVLIFHETRTGSAVSNRCPTRC